MSQVGDVEKAMRSRLNVKNISQKMWLIRLVNDKIWITVQKLVGKNNL